jgi:pimeloyl-ACP methyl ester carboxylesterase
MTGLPGRVNEPPLPHGRRVELRDRGTTFVREVEGPPGAPTLLLLHGWIASGGLNWFQVFEPLGEHFHVIAPDLRGHARGVRSRRIFRLADCADDTAETLVTLGTGPVIAVGYSMGGPVAQLLWRRHRDLVAGLVLCATAPGFVPFSSARVAYQSWMLAWATVARVAAFAPGLPGLPTGRRPRGLPEWVAAEMRRHDWRMIVEAGQSLSTYYAGRWIGEVDVPTTVVCTSTDRAVRPDLQREMAAAIPDATVVEVADGHLLCGRPQFAEPLLDACLEVADRAASAPPFGRRSRLSRDDELQDGEPASGD